MFNNPELVAEEKIVEHSYYLTIWDHDLTVQPNARYPGLEPQLKKYVSYVTLKIPKTILIGTLNWKTKKELTLKNTELLFHIVFT